MQSFYVDITKCRTAEKDLATCEGDLKSASRKLDSAGDGLRGMSGALSMVGQSVEHLSDEAKIESKEVEQLRQALHNILDLYYNQEAGLIGQAVDSGIQDIINIIGQTIGDRVHDIADIIGRGAEAVEEYIREQVYNGLDFLGRTVSGFSDRDYWDAYFSQLGRNTGEDFGGILNIIDNFEIPSTINSLLTMPFSIEDGAVLEYFWNGGTADGLGPHLNNLHLNPNPSTFSNVCKWGGRVLDGLDLVGVVRDDFLDVIYNEETRQCEWTAQNVGYFATDVLIDGGVTIGCNIVGDLAGEAAGAAVTACFAPTGPGLVVGVVLGEVVDVAVSTVVSNGCEFIVNFDLPIDLNGDGEFDSAVDMAKIIGHHTVDSAIAIGEFVSENIADYMMDNHPEFTQTIIDGVTPIAEASQAVFDYATDKFDEGLNAVLDIEQRTVEHMNDLIDNGFDYMSDSFDNGVGFVTNQFENATEFARDVFSGDGLEGAGEYINNTIENGADYLHNQIDNMADAAQDFASDTVDFFGDCLSYIGL